MKIKIPRNIRKYLIIYLAMVLGLYLVIVMVPKMTSAFETTEILEPGNLTLTCEAEGYLIKKEAIAVAPESGKLEYLVKEGAAVSKNRKVVSIEGTGEDGDVSVQYSGPMKNLEGYGGVYLQKNAPISGIFSLSMDGAEAALNPSNMDELTYDKMKDISFRDKNLEAANIDAGEPMYKMTDDNKWYVVCWLKKDRAADYSEGQEVKLQLPTATVDAVIRSIKKDEKRYRIIFTSYKYYKELASTRQVDMTIINSERTGLIIDNDSIIEKDGVSGVYVRNKNGNYHFVQVNVIETDGKESVISESSFYDPDKEDIVYTVSVYDEVSKEPKKELKREMKELEKQKKKQ